jgi:hypothetical protein
LKNLLFAMSRTVLIPNAWASSSASFSVTPASAETGASAISLKGLPSQALSSALLMFIGRSSSRVGWDVRG